jgi:predicted nucleic acid-binding protein
MTSFVLLCEILTVIQKSEFIDRISEAKELLSEHTKDAPYFALALELNCAIWSSIFSDFFFTV